MELVRQGAYSPESIRKDLNKAVYFSKIFDIIDLVS